LDTFNRMMQKSFTVDALSQSGSASVLSQGPVLSKTVQKTLNSFSPSALPSLGMGVTSSPQSTAQLLDMAMAVVQQNPSAAALDTETLGNWVSRTAPTVNPAEAASESPAPVAPTAVPTAPPGAVEARPEPSEPVPNNDGGGTAPADPAPPALPAPSSGVQWLLPTDGVAAWTQGLSAPVDLNPSETNPSGLMGAVAKLGQWLGWGSAGPAQPPDPG